MIISNKRFIKGNNIYIKPPSIEYLVDISVAYGFMGMDIRLDKLNYTGDMNKYHMSLKYFDPDNSGYNDQLIFDKGEHTAGYMLSRLENGFIKKSSIDKISHVYDCLLTLQMSPLMFSLSELI